MHAFQNMPAEMIEIDPFTSIGKEWALLMAEKDGKANGMTISWGAMGVLWGKNVVFVFVRDSRYTKEFIDGSDTFSVNFFGGKEMNALKYFGKVSGRDEDKFKSANFTVNHHKGIGFVDECNFSLVCKKMSETKILPEQFLDSEIQEKWYGDNDYHTMYVGEIVDFLAR